MPSSRALAAVLLLGATSALAAQRTSAVIQVRVVDSTGAPIGKADVAITRGLAAAIANATTDDAGVAALTVPRGNDDVELVVRRLGFQRGGRFFHADRDSLAFVVTLFPTAQSLPAVRVTAEENLSLKRFHVTADDIAAAKRSINDGLDVVTKLRPDMMDPPGQGVFARCGLYDLWINGKHVLYAPVDPALAIKTAEEIHVARTTANPAAKRPPHYIPQSTVPVTVQSALAKIHPEHIDEMNYVDCRDTKSTTGAHQQNAVFVVLKAGVAYDAVRGSYVLDDTAPFRNRLLGVFDETTGNPIAGVEVIDAATGTFATTTATGTVTLAFLPEGKSSLRLRRAGYAEREVGVTIGPRDTIPLTLLLTPKPR